MRKRFINRSASCVLALSITALNIFTCPAAVYAKQSELSELSSLDSLEVVSPDDKKNIKDDTSLQPLSEISDLEDTGDTQIKTNQIFDLSETELIPDTETEEGIAEDITTDDVMSYFSTYGEKEEEESGPVDMLTTDIEFENFEDLLGEGAYFSIVADSISFETSPDDVCCGNIATNNLNAPDNSKTNELYKFGTKGTNVIAESYNPADLDVLGQRLYIAKDSKVKGYFEEKEASANSRYVDVAEKPEEIKALQSYIAAEDTGVLNVANSNLHTAYNNAKNKDSLKFLKDVNWNSNTKRYEIDCTKLDGGMFIYDIAPEQIDNAGAEDYLGDEEYPEDEAGIDENADEDNLGADDKHIKSYKDWENGELWININSDQYILFVDNGSTASVNLGAVDLHVTDNEGEEQNEQNASMHLIWYFEQATKISLNDKTNKYYGSFVAPKATFIGNRKDNQVNDSNIRILAKSVEGNTKAELYTKAEVALEPVPFEIPIEQQIDNCDIKDFGASVKYGYENDIPNFFYNNTIFCKVEVFEEKENENGEKFAKPLDQQPQLHMNRSNLIMTLGKAPCYYIRLTSDDYLMSSYILDKRICIIKAEPRERFNGSARSDFSKTDAYEYSISAYMEEELDMEDVVNKKLDPVGRIIFTHQKRLENEAISATPMPNKYTRVTVVLSDTSSTDVKPTKTPTKTPTPSATPTKKATKTPTPTTSRSSSYYSGSTKSSNYDYDDYYDDSKTSTSKKDTTKKKKPSTTPTKIPAAVGIKGINSSLGEYDDAIASGAKSDKQRRDNSPIKIYMNEDKPGNRVVVSVSQMQELKEQKAKYEEKSVKAGNYGGAPYQGAGADIKNLVSKVSSAVIPKTPLGAVLFWIIPVAVLALLLLRARSKWHGAVLGKNDKGIVVKRSLDSEDNSLQQMINMSESVGESLDELRDRLRKSHTSSYMPLNMKMKIVLITPARATTLAICNANEEKMYSLLSEYEDRECKVKVIFFKNERENCAELEFSFGNRKWNKETIFETKPLTLDFNAI